MICSICQRRTDHKASSCPRRRKYCLAIGCTLMLALSGCATTKEMVAVDTFCLQKKRTWSMDDTPETVREAQVFNGTIDRRCGVKQS
jgi:hypothetical protein